MAEKKRKGRREYLKSFRRDGTGAYSYQGALYSFCADEMSLRSLLARLWAAGLTALAASAAPGFFPVPGMEGRVYVLLPYAAGLIAAVCVCWTVYRLSTAGDPMREYVYRATVQRLPFRARAAFVCSALAFAGETVCVFRGGARGMERNAFFFLALEAVSALASGALCRLAVRCGWKETEKDVSANREDSL